MYGAGIPPPYWPESSFKLSLLASEKFKVGLREKKQKKKKYEFPNFTLLKCSD